MMINSNAAQGTLAANDSTPITSTDLIDSGSLKKTAACRLVLIVLKLNQKDLIATEQRLYLLHRIDILLEPEELCWLETFATSIRETQT